MASRFHQLGKHKWELLQLDYAFAEIKAPTTAEIEKAATIFKQYFNPDIVVIK